MRRLAAALAAGAAGVAGSAASSPMIVIRAATPATSKAAVMRNLVSRGRGELRASSKGAAPPQPQLHVEEAHKRVVVVPPRVVTAAPVAADPQDRKGALPAVPVVMASATQTLAALEQESKTLTDRFAALAADDAEKTRRSKADLERKLELDVADLEHAKQQNSELLRANADLESHNAKLERESREVEEGAEQERKMLTLVKAKMGAGDVFLNRFLMSSDSDKKVDAQLQRQREAGLEADRSGGGVTSFLGIGSLSVSVSSSARGTGYHDLTWVKSTAEDAQSLQMLTEMRRRLHKLHEEENGAIESLRRAFAQKSAEVAAQKRQVVEEQEALLLRQRVLKERRRSLKQRLAASKKKKQVLTESLTALASYFRNLADFAVATDRTGSEKLLAKIPHLDAGGGGK